MIATENKEEKWTLSICTDQLRLQLSGWACHHLFLLCHLLAICHSTSLWWNGMILDWKNCRGHFSKIQSVLDPHSSHPSYVQNRLLPSSRLLRSHPITASGSGLWSRILQSKSGPRTWCSSVAVPWIQPSTQVFSIRRTKETSYLRPILPTTTVR